MRKFKLGKTCQVSSKMPHLNLMLNLFSIKKNRYCHTGLFYKYKQLIIKSFHHHDTLILLIGKLKKTLFLFY
ncbi:MAG TPA: hypothetical protein DCY06_14175 [Bacteroidetes bacterium]|nr:hypothetical protein [Bacteroidota bacterium]